MGGWGDVFGGAADRGYKAASQILTKYNDLQRKDFQPYMDAGYGALEELVNKVKQGPGDYKESPGYQFQLDEGIKAVNRAAAARGASGAGGTTKDIMRYAQGLASSDYDQFLNRYYQSLNPYLSLSNLGYGATTATNQLTNNYMNAIAQANIDRGRSKDAAMGGVISGLASGIGAFAMPALGVGAGLSGTGTSMLSNAIGQSNLVSGYQPNFAWSANSFPTLKE